MDKQLQLLKNAHMLLTHNSRIIDNWNEGNMLTIEQIWDGRLFFHL